MVLTYKQLTNYDDDSRALFTARLEIHHRTSLHFKIDKFVTMKNSILFPMLSITISLATNTLYNNPLFCVTKPALVNTYKSFCLKQDKINELFALTIYLHCMLFCMNFIVNKLQQENNFESKKESLYFQICKNAVRMKDFLENVKNNCANICRQAKNGEISRKSS